MTNRATDLKKLLKSHCTNRIAQEKWKPDRRLSLQNEKEWGSQIRIMYMHPYKLSEDGVQVKKREMIDAVMDGHIDKFLKGILNDDGNKKKKV